MGDTKESLTEMEATCKEPHRESGKTGQEHASPACQPGLMSGSNKPLSSHSYVIAWPCLPPPSWQGLSSVFMSLASVWGGLLIPSHDLPQHLQSNILVLGTKPVTTQEKQPGFSRKLLMITQLDYIGYKNTKALNSRI